MVDRRRYGLLLCAVLAAGGVLVWFAAAAFSATGGGAFVKGCKPSGARLVAANRYARVYYLEDTLGYCRPGRREPEGLGLEVVYPPPAISLAGPYLGFSAKVNEGVSGLEFVKVIDVRRPDRSSFFHTISAGAGVGSLKVNRRGSVAWIECPQGDVGTDEKLTCGTASPPGFAVSRTVYRHDGRSTEQKPAQLLARGPSIKLRSLRRKRSTISWTENGKTRRASFR